MALSRYSPFEDDRHERGSLLLILMDISTTILSSRRGCSRESVIARHIRNALEATSCRISSMPKSRLRSRCRPSRNLGGLCSGHSTLVTGSPPGPVRNGILTLDPRNDASAGVRSRCAPHAPKAGEHLLRQVDGRGMDLIYKSSRSRPDS